MNITALSSLFFLSVIKFMFAPFGGPALQLTFIETYIICCSGAVVGSAVFYFSAEYFLIRSRKKIAEGKSKPKKKFSRSNKVIVKIKHTLGIIGVTFWCPFFLSIPIGSIIAAKFYGKRIYTYPLIVLGISINGIITTSLAYFVFT